MRMNDGRFFPDSLLRRNIWVLWRLEKGKNGKLTKVPYSGVYDGKASSTCPNTWTTFERVDQIYKNAGDFYSGVGICIKEDGGIVFIDIDHCIDEEDNMSETAMDILNHLGDQFVELSQSGTGLHIIALGEIPCSFKNSRNGVEMYNGKRFVATTGHSVGEGEPHEDPEALRYVYETYRPQKREIPSYNRTEPGRQRDDKWIIEHASQRGIFEDLYAGNWEKHYESQSEADLALCNILAFWCDCSHEQIDRIFRTSSLYRKKWERDDYRNKTISNAILNCGQTLSEFIREGDAEFERAFLENW